MVKQTKKIILSALLLFVILFTSDCANQLPPGGGEVDKIPPEIISVYPADGALNFSDDYFELEFSEYVDKRSVKEAIFISPALEGNTDISWTGKTLTVTFPEKLRENTTYNITIGTDVADFNNRNKMSQAFSFTFSTGDKLDRRVISGKIFSEKPQGVFLFAYLNAQDTLNPSTSKPDYISQSGIDGSYKIPGLAAGTYRIYAVQDEFRDLLFQPEQDAIGVPFGEVVLTETDTLYAGLDFFISRIDTAAPRILTSVMTDKYHLLLTFSEELDQSSVTARNFHLYDSTDNMEVNPLYAYRNFSKPTEIVLALQNDFKEGSLVYLFADSIKDRSGNTYFSEQNSVTVSLRGDTIYPAITRMNPVSGMQNSDFQNQLFSFSFNDGIDSAVVKQYTEFSDTLGNRVNFRLTFLDDANFEIIPTQKLEPSKDYIISFDLSGIYDAAENNKDTIFQYRFKTISGLDFTGAAGTVENIEFLKNPVLLLQGVDGKKITYSQKIAANKFSFERVEPGTYRLWTFYDKDSSGNYSGGSYFPFKLSEEFSYYPDSLNLRPRWAITDIKFNSGK